MRAVTEVLSAGARMRTEQGFEVGAEDQSEFKMVWEWPQDLG